MDRTDETTGTVIKWAYRHFHLGAEFFATLDEALLAAKVSADYGEEALDCIEVLIPGGPNRIIGANEVDELVRPLREEETRRYAEQPLAVAAVDLMSPSGVVSCYDNFASIAEAEADAARLRVLLGEDRVTVRTLTAAVSP